MNSYNEHTELINDNETLISAVNKNPNLMSLKLIAHGKLGEEAISHLFRRCTKLREIDFGNALTGSHALNSISRQSVTLHKISIGDIGWSKELCLRLNEILVPNSLYSLNSSVCSDFVALLPNHGSCLRELMISGDGGRDIDQIISHCPNLRTLYFTSYKPLSDANLFAISTQMVSLEVLSLEPHNCYCDMMGGIMDEITDVGIKALMEMNHGKLHFFTEFTRKCYWPSVSEECWQRLLAWRGRNPDGTLK